MICRALTVPAEAISEGGFCLTDTQVDFVPIKIGTTSTDAEEGMPTLKLRQLKQFRTFLRNIFFSLSGSWRRSAAPPNEIKAIDP
jgi:hypothetical protein